MNITLYEEPRNLAILTRANALLVQAANDRDPMLAKDVRDAAKAAAVWARQKKLGNEALTHARRIELDADRVLAEMMRAAPKAKAGRPYKTIGVNFTPINLEQADQPLTLEDLGIDKNEAKEIRAVGKLSEQEFCAVRDEGKTPAQVARETRERNAKEALTRPVELQIDGLLRGDFRQLAATIPDESVELVFTDPPYDRDSLPLYEAAAREAARILKPGGSMICYVGQVLLPDVLPLMSKHLRYWWTAACVHDGGNQMLQKLGIRCGWKPMLWFVKGTRGDVQAVLRDTVSGAREKAAHEWQQAEAEAAHFINGLTSENGVVVDFFAGGGTTCVVAEQLGRRWIAYEVDARHYAAAAKRITQRRVAA